jgi:hypothetical protein
MAESRRLFLAGRKAFDEGRLDAAIASFEAAYQAAPLPALWFNIAQCHRRKFLLSQDPESLRRAIDDYRRYLTEVPNAEHRVEATQQLAELTPLLARIAPERLGVVAPPSPPPVVQPAEPAPRQPVVASAPEPQRPPALLASPPPKARGPSRRTAIAIAVSVTVVVLAAGAVGLAVGLQPHTPETTLGDVRSTK